MAWDRNHKRNGFLAILVFLGCIALIVPTVASSDKHNGSNMATSYEMTVSAFDTPSELKADADYICDGIKDEHEIQAAIDATRSGGIVKLLPGTYTKSTAAGIDIWKDTITVEGTGKDTIITLANDIKGDACIFRSSNKKNITIRQMVLNGNEANQSKGNHYALDFDDVTESKVRIWIEDFRNGEAKLQNCTVDLLNIYYAPGVNSTFVIDGFDVLSRKEHSSNVSIAGDTAEGRKFSTQLIPTDGSFEYVDIILDPPLDLRFKQFEIWFKIDKPANVSIMQLQFWTDNSNSESFVFDFGHVLRHQIQSNEWTKVVIGKSAADRNPVDLGDWAWRHIKRIRFDVVSEEGTSASVKVDNLMAITPLEHPLFTFVFDDGQSSDVTIVAPVLQSYGWSASQALCISNAGTRITTEEINRLYSEFGWDILSHGLHDIELTTLPAETVLEELTLSKVWLEEQGFTRGSDIFVFPHSAFNSQSLRLAKEVYASWRTGIEPVDADVPLIQRVYLMDYPQTFDSVQSMIDTTFKFHEWLVLVGHEVVEYPVEHQTSADLFISICEYLKDLGVTVQTMSEILTESIAPRPEANS
ncbi:MAG: polysaccharide deacetylase family protein [Chloroflexota bacterium]|nr:polysaccharide deacetylase family protein [Chloroflexota bacterium]